MENLRRYKKDQLIEVIAEKDIALDDINNARLNDALEFRVQKVKLKSQVEELCENLSYAKLESETYKSILYEIENGISAVLAMKLPTSIEFDQTETPPFSDDLKLLMHFKKLIASSSSRMPF